MLPDSIATDFCGKVLLGIGADANAKAYNIAIEWMLHWRTFEQDITGPDAEWNPLNTTRTKDVQGAPLSFTLFNSAGVCNYPDETTGVIATIATLTDGFYDSILGALRSGNYSDVEGLATAVDKWGTTGFAIAIRGGFLLTNPTPPASTLTPELINAAMQDRMFLTRVANTADYSLVQKAVALLKTNGITV